MDDMVHRRHVESTRSDVRRKEHGVLRGAEPIKVFEALPLLELRVKGERGEAEQCEERKESPDAVDGGKEDEGAARVA